MLNTTGERIRYAIKQSGKKQNAVAKAIGVTAQAVNKWIRDGQISKENLFQLANETGFSYIWIVQGAGAMQTNNLNEPSPPNYYPTDTATQQDSNYQLDFDKEILQKSLEAADYFETILNTKLKLSKKMDIICNIYCEYKNQKQHGKTLMDSQAIIDFTKVATLLKED